VGRADDVGTTLDDGMMTAVVNQFFGIPKEIEQLSKSTKEEKLIAKDSECIRLIISNTNCTTRGRFDKKDE